MACVWHIFGRLGCFLAGCCHGRPTTWPWGIAFTDPRSQVFAGWLGVPLHPTQLIEAAGDAVIAFFLYKLFRREGGSGRVAAAFFGLYGLLRFSVEFLRGDTVPLPIGLTAGQVLSLGLMVGSSAFWVWRISHPPRR
jgi:phosphatidylglycerol:prolipoprotein diacylglycerol transferase